YANPEALEDRARRRRIDDLVMLLESVLVARRRVMLEVNASAECLEAVVAVLPSMRQATVAPLFGNGGYAVKAAVPRDALPQVIPAVKAAGGTDLVVSTFETALAARVGVAPDRLLVTAGADEGIDRACRAFLEPGRTLVLPDPSFDMFDCSATLTGGELVRLPWWGDAFPIDAFVGRLDARTAVVAVVSPNNPTGSVATLADVRRVA